MRKNQVTSAVPITAGETRTARKRNLAQMKKFKPAGTATQTAERVLETTMTENERNRIARDANERFIKSGIEIRDVYGKLAE
jgi:signal transduction histidine kinase